MPREGPFNSVMKTLLPPSDTPAPNRTPAPGAVRATRKWTSCIMWAVTVNQSEAAAHHETGHAVIALVTGADLKRVTILARKRLINCQVIQTRGFTESWLP